MARRLSARCWGSQTAAPGSRLRSPSGGAATVARARTWGLGVPALRGWGSSCAQPCRRAPPPVDGGRVACCRQMGRTVVARCSRSSAPRRIAGAPSVESSTPARLKQRHRRRFSLSENKASSCVSDAAVAAADTRTHTRVSGVGSPPEVQAGQRFQRGEFLAVVVVFNHGRQWRPGVVSLFAPPFICQSQTNGQIRTAKARFTVAQTLCCQLPCN